MTREHLLPQWLSEVLSNAFPSEHGYDFAYVFTTEAGEGPLRTYGQPTPELVVKAVCEDCNGGWMSALEAETKPFLEPMVRGDDIRLGEADQAILARWAAKVVVLLDHYEAGAVILAPRDTEQVFRGQAPSGFHIRLAYRADDEPAAFDFFLTNHFATQAGITTRDAPDASDPNSFSVTMGLGRAAITVVGGPAIDNPARWVSGSDFPLMIWPPTPAGIEWPPKHPILRSHEDLRDFHETFWTEIRNRDFPRPDALGHIQ
ncbi:MAG: hypothetical protein ACYDH6_16600 [Acidimicrobiales bacterium]